MLFEVLAGGALEQNYQHNREIWMFQKSQMPRVFEQGVWAILEWLVHKGLKELCHEISPLENVHFIEQNIQITSQKNKQRFKLEEQIQTEGMDWQN